MLAVGEGEKAVNGLNMLAVAVGQSEDPFKLAVKFPVEDFLPAAPDVPKAGGAVPAGVSV